MSREDYVEAVLSVVEQIPPGRVMAYGDIAEYVGSGGPRQVGRVMSQHGGGVPWWRVVRADGHPHDAHAGEAIRRLRAEGTPFKGAGGVSKAGDARIDMARARWDGSTSTSDPRL